MDHVSCVTSALCSVLMWHLSWYVLCMCDQPSAGHPAAVPGTAHKVTDQIATSLPQLRRAPASPSRLDATEAGPNQNLRVQAIKVRGIHPQQPSSSLKLVRPPLTTDKRITNHTWGDQQQLAIKTQQIKNIIKG